MIYFHFSLRLQFFFTSEFAVGNKKEACFRTCGPVARSPIQLPYSDTEQQNRSVFIQPSASMTPDGLLSNLAAEGLFREALQFH